MAIETTGGVKNILNVNNTNKWVKDLDVNAKGTLELKDLNVTENQKTFGEFLANSVSKVNDLQKDANTAIQKLATGEAKNIHETLILAEQADIAFRMMNQVRLKVIEAYKEVMRMQV